MGGGAGVLRKWVSSFGSSALDHVATAAQQKQDARIQLDQDTQVAVIHESELAAEETAAAPCFLQQTCEEGATCAGGVGSELVDAYRYLHPHRAVFTYFHRDKSEVAVPDAHLGRTTRFDQDIGDVNPDEDYEDNTAWTGLSGGHEAMRLDGFLVSPNSLYRLVDCGMVLAMPASDHRPVFLELLPPRSPRATSALLSAANCGEQDGDEGGSSASGGLQSRVEEDAVEIEENEVVAVEEIGKGAASSTQAVSQVLAQRSSSGQSISWSDNSSSTSRSGSIRSHFEKEEGGQEQQGREQEEGDNKEQRNLDKAVLACSRTWPHEPLNKPLVDMLRKMAKYEVVVDGKKKARRQLRFDAENCIFGGVK
jgi:hypothetical protein